MGELISGYDVYNGKTTSPTMAGYNSMLQPIQFLPDRDKTLEYIISTMNWVEWQGLKMLSRNLNWMAKNYKLANNQIDKRDYVRDENNEYAELVDHMTREGETAMEIKSYPFIKLVVDILSNEYAKRSTKLFFKMNDERSYNEMKEEKKAAIEQSLLAQATIKQANRLMEMGLSPESEQGQQALASDTIKSLPEIQEFYTKSYRSMYQQWAEIQKANDDDRFYMREQERLAFRDSLIADRAFFHLKMFDNDYKVEKWNPKQVFYRKSPNERYISNGQWVGMVDMMTIPDVIDNYGWMMSAEQMESLNVLFPIRGIGYAIDGKAPDQYYDSTMSYKWNRTGPGLGMRQFMSVAGNTPGLGSDIVNQLLSDSEDLIDANPSQYVRVSTMYWKTQRKVGWLTRISEDSPVPIQEPVTEEYKITDKPIYNTLVYKGKTKENLVYGEHIDWMWINEVWGGIKIGPSMPMYGWNSNNGGFTPMYLGLQGGKPGRIPFQFKGDDNLFGCKLPVEGCVFNDYNTHSRAVVDILKPWQIGYNMANNQISDLMVDELGVIITFDPNALPKHSLGEDWGPDNFPKAVAFMRDHGFLPLQPGIANAGVPVNPQHFQKWDLSQSERLLNRIKLAEYFKNEGLATLGLNPQRVGTPIDQEQTATGIHQAVAASYSSTEHLYTQFDDLMVQVNQMRTNLAQYYNSSNPSVRLQYTTNDGMKQWFTIDGTQLMGRDFGVTCQSDPRARFIMQEMKQLLLTNNTTGANMPELMQVVKAESIPEIDNIMTSIQQRVDRERQQDMQQDQSLQQQDLEQQWAMHEDKQAFEAEQKELDRQSQEYIAQVRAAVATGSVDLDKNAQSDYLDSLKVINQQQQHQDKMNLEQNKQITQTALEKQKINLREKEIVAENHRTNATLKINRINTKTKDKSKKK